MAVTDLDVRHVAMLAKLRISEDEAERFARDLESIIEYVDMLAQVSADDAVAGAAAEPPDALPPSAAGKGVLHVMLTPDEALANAPDREGDEFRVPGFLPL
jgi:aspartyl-tRNA(Asn)/glutamyl-tRNA(Gln) amidotransferase subunit C